MDVYLEILKHSGPGRLGEFYLRGEEITTPNYFHPANYSGKHDVYLASNSRTKKKPVVYDYSLFVKSKILPSKFGLLPDFTAGFDVPRALAEEALNETLETARMHPEQGAVITGGKFPDLVEKSAGELKDHPLVAIANGQKMARNPRLLAEVLPRIRGVISPNTALYFPSAPLALFPVLAYMGVDFFDSSQVLMGAVREEFLTQWGFKSMKEIDGLRCYCYACRGKAAHEVIGSPKALVLHNLGFIRGVLSEIRAAIMEDSLRELVEAKSSYDAASMAVLRILDHEKGDYLEKYTGASSRAPIRFISQESYTRPEVTRWQKRMAERYSPPKGKKLTVFLPCSAKKPYRKSKSHMLFRKYIRRGAKRKLSLVHEVTITSPLGVVPRELEDVYPASSYDTPTTGHWSRDEKEVAVEQLRLYNAKAGTRAIAHVDGAYREICSAAGVELGVEGVLSKASLEHLSARISELLADETASDTHKVDEARKVCEYQFGLGAGEHLLPEGASVKGYQLFCKGEQVAAVNPADGSLALTLQGGELLRDYSKYLVNISFRPETDSIFCVGVEKAGEEIRPGDEAIVLYEGKVVGVGKAMLSGHEMTRARKGLAVKLRHRG